MAGVWTVLSQRQYEDLTDAGGFVPVVEVTFQLVASGVTGSVKVPLRSYTEDNVRALINAQAVEMSRVQNLEG